MAREGFVFYRSFAEAFRGLDASQYREIMTAISDYALDGIEPEGLDPVLYGYFLLVKPQIDANEAKRQAKIKNKSKEECISGEEPETKRNKTEQNGTSENKQEQKCTKEKGKEKVKEKVNVKDKYNTPITPSTEGEPVPAKKMTKAEQNKRLLARLRGYTDSTSPVYLTTLEHRLQDWMQYKGESGFAYKETGLVAFLAQVDKYTAQYGENVVCDAINQAMGNGWKGVLWKALEESRPAPKRGKFDVDDYIRRLEEEERNAEIGNRKDPESA